MNTMFSDLPNELLLKIFDEDFSSQELAEISKVSRKFKELMEDLIRLKALKALEDIYKENIHPIDKAEALKEKGLENPTCAILIFSTERFLAIIKKGEFPYSSIVDIARSNELVNLYFLQRRNLINILLEDKFSGGRWLEDVATFCSKGAHYFLVHYLALIRSLVEEELFNRATVDGIREVATREISTARLTEPTLYEDARAIFTPRA